MIQATFLIHYTGSGNPKGWFNIEILNASNNIVSLSQAYYYTTSITFETVLVTGLAILSAGTYHTRVTVNKQSSSDGTSVFQSAGANRDLNYSFRYFRIDSSRFKSFKNINRHNGFLLWIPGHAASTHIKTAVPCFVAC